MTEAELLEAIYAAPDDDAPRLVYADWLLERGEPRGEFIVRQCRGDAATELMLEHDERWLGELSPVLAARAYERGFLATARMHELPEHHELAGHPELRLVRELRTTDDRPGVLAFALHPSMTELRVLRVANERELWRELLTGTPRNIVELHYRPTIEHVFSGATASLRVSTDEFAALARCSALPKLRKLVLNGVPESSMLTLFGGALVDRIQMVETHHGPIAIKIAGGIAAVTVPPTAPHSAQAVLNLIRLLPGHLAIELETSPRFQNRQLIERALGRRLRR